MATIDVQERKNTVEVWIMEHGAASAVVGCVLFWLTLGVSLYFVL